MKEILRMAHLMDKDNFFIQIFKHIKDFGRIIIKMDMEK
jgi:hypothetical protein